MAAKIKVKKVVDFERARAAAKPTESALADAVEESYNVYGRHTLLHRAIPDFRDGLKPVQRRIIWSGYKLGLYPSRGFKKAATVVGSCLAAGTKVVTRNGLEDVEDLQVGDIVATRFGPRPVATVFANPPEKMLRITTKGGQVDASYTHPFLVLRNLKLLWVKAKDLSPADCMVRFDATSQPTVLRKPSARDNALCYLAGHFAGNGSLSYNKGYPRVTFCSASKSCISHVIKCLKEIDVAHYRLSARRSSVTAGAKLYSVRCSHPGTRRLFKCFRWPEGYTTSAVSKELPEFALKKGSAVYHTLAGLIDTDGSVRINDKHKEIVFSTSSPKLKKQYIDILHLFGTSPEVYARQPGRYANSSISGHTVVQRLTNFSVVTMGVDVWKILRGLPLSNAARKPTRDQLRAAKNAGESARNAVPGAAEFIRKVVRAGKLGYGPADQGRYLHKDGKTILRVSLRYNNGYIFRLTANRAITTTTLRETNIVEFLHLLGYHDEAKTLSVIREIEVGISPVKSISRLPKKAPTFDIEVSGVHEFIANGYVSHNCMGAHHPHGDAAIYGALVNLVNAPISLFDGEGNWGNPSTGDPAAAMRYTECKLSVACEDLLLDRRALAVVDMVPNFDASREEPIVLPARLPLVLLNSAEGISVGATTNLPSFEAEGLKKLLALALTRKDYKVTSAECAKYLKLHNRDGGQPTSTKSVQAKAWGDGQGRVEWVCDYTVDAKAGTVTVTGIAPDWKRDSALAKIRAMPEVKHVRDIAAGDEVVKIEIGLKRTAKGTAFDKAVEAIAARLTSATTYRLNVTERHKAVTEDGLADADAVFNKVTLPDLLARWLAWRVSVVKAVAQREVELLRAKRRTEEVLLLAIENLEKVVAILTDRSKKVKATKPERIARALKITVDEAMIIWGTPIGRFDRLTAGEQQAKLKELRVQEAAEVVIVKKPVKATAADIAAIEIVTGVKSKKPRRKEK